jgi:hypothetical protein
MGRCLRRSGVVSGARRKALGSRAIRCRSSDVAPRLTCGNTARSEPWAARGPCTTENQCDVCRWQRTARSVGRWARALSCTDERSGVVLHDQGPGSGGRMPPPSREHVRTGPAGQRTGPAGQVAFPEQAPLACAATGSPSGTLRLAMARTPLPHLAGQPSRLKEGAGARARSVRALCRRARPAPLQHVVEGRSGKLITRTSAGSALRVRSVGFSRPSRSGGSALRLGYGWTAGAWPGCWTRAR